MKFITNENHKALKKLLNRMSEDANDSGCRKRRELI